MHEVIVKAGMVILAIFIIGLIVTAINPEMTNLFARVATRISGVAS